MTRDDFIIQMNEAETRFLRDPFFEKLKLFSIHNCTAPIIFLSDTNILFVYGQETPYRVEDILRFSYSVDVCELTFYFHGNHSLPYGPDILKIDLDDNELWARFKDIEYVPSGACDRGTVLSLYRSILDKRRGITTPLYDIVDGVLKSVISTDESMYKIPDGVHEIGSGSFSFLNNFSTVVIPDTVRIIAPKAFCGCSNLEHIVIPFNGLESIGESAFYGCKNLIHFDLPSSVSHIGDFAFTETELKEVWCNDTERSRSIMTSSRGFPEGVVFFDLFDTSMME